MGNWNPHPQFGNTRELRYMAHLDQPIGPSSARCYETQRYTLTREKFTTETISLMYDIPYYDYFRIEGRWEVVPGIAPSSCKLTVHVGVHFMKKTWFKSKIESSAIKSSQESFKLWVSLAKEEISKIRTSQSSAEIETDPIQENKIPVDIAPNITQVENIPPINANKTPPLIYLPSTPKELTINVAALILFSIFLHYVVTETNFLAFYILLMGVFLLYWSVNFEKRVKNMENKITLIQQKLLNEQQPIIKEQ